MKKDIHPQYFTKAVISCVCGNSFTTGSTMEELRVEICSACHPFYTGKQKLVDTARRVEKFQARTEKKDEASKARLGKKVKRARASAKKTEEKTKSKK
ncbi:50S ribosomal protein L31 [Candidatus Uhrbacteria bacterium]|nr:50S ribosomal protein L31 [Candidatus Uhrbacteria bacterium]